MVDLAILGSICLDTIKTPFGEREDMLGGSAVYAALAASVFAKPGMLGIVGTDFNKEHFRTLSAKGIDLLGVEVKDGQTFRWKAAYGAEMKDAETLDTQFHVMNGAPAVPESYKNIDYLLLGNQEPTVQMKVLESLYDYRRPRFVMADTINLYIENNKRDVLHTFSQVDVAILNETEVRMLTGIQNTVNAGRSLLEDYMTYDEENAVVIIKRGEYGAMMLTRCGCFVVPALPCDCVVDPTGAGDSFAGGFMGWMAKSNDMSIRNMKRAMVFGSAAASCTIQGFGTDGILCASGDEVYRRFMRLQDIMSF